MGIVSIWLYQRRVLSPGEKLLAAVMPIWVIRVFAKLPDVLLAAVVCMSVEFCNLIMRNRSGFARDVLNRFQQSSKNCCNDIPVHAKAQVTRDAYYSGYIKKKYNLTFYCPFFVLLLNLSDRVFPFCVSSMCRALPPWEKKQSVISG